MSMPIFWISDKKIDAWSRKKNIFFILSIGRSGTQFLSALLNQSPQAYVVHEPVRKDFKAYIKAFHDETDAEKYIIRFRKKNIYARASKKNISTYGEVNSVLRRHGPALKRSFPDAHIIHLIRDGRAMVRSAMSRLTMTERDPNTQGISPSTGDPWRDKWPHMSRFERICWYWDIENRYLNKHIERSIQFEKIVSSYDYFKNNLLGPLNLEINKDIWDTETRAPQNITKEHVFSHWTEWESKETEAFLRICGETMMRNGYRI